MADEAGTTTTATTEPQTAPAADVAPAAAPVETTPTSILSEASTAKPVDAPQDGTEAKPVEAAPALPEKYELTAPEGFTLDPEAMTAADPVFRELNLSNDQAQKLVPVAADFAKRIQESARQAADSDVQALRATWANEAQSDKEIGGTKWPETVHLAAKALDYLGYPEGSSFRALLAESGLGNNPEMIRAFRKVGELVGEDGDFVRANAAPPVKLSREEQWYPSMTKKD